MRHGGSINKQTVIAPHTTEATMTTHTHRESTSRPLPFGGISLATCVCGARRRSDAEPISGGHLDMDGWYLFQVMDAGREAYDRLQSEGCEDTTEPIDMADEFDRPAAQ